MAARVTRFAPVKGAVTAAVNDATAVLVEHFDGVRVVVEVAACDDSFAPLQLVSTSGPPVSLHGVIDAAPSEVRDAFHDLEAAVCIYIDVATAAGERLPVSLTLPL